MRTKLLEIQGMYVPLLSCHNNTSSGSYVMHKFIYINQTFWWLKQHILQHKDLNKIFYNRHYYHILSLMIRLTHWLFFQSLYVKPRVCFQSDQFCALPDCYTLCLCCYTWCLYCYTLNDATILYICSLNVKFICICRNNWSP
jgi:hypothetical protein